MAGAGIDLDIFKDIPGYRGILKAVLRYQIQLLVEQLCKHGGEESVLLSANLTEGTLSHLGTEGGKGFLTDNNEVKRQYLGYCLKNHQKRKAEFMSPSSSNENLQQSKVVYSKPESVATYPVHKKHMVQRRNTRLRSGGKYSPFYTKTGFNRPTLQKIATQSAYRDKTEHVQQNQGQFLNNLIGSADSSRQQETLKTQYPEPRLDDDICSKTSDITVKTENTTDNIALQTKNVMDEKNSREGIIYIQNESAVCVKVECQEESSETGNNVSTEMSEDIQTLSGSRLGHHFTPNASIETEDSFSEGNQSFEYVMDQENSDNAISPWKQDEAEKLSLFTSKRKQALPTRIKKHSEQIGEKSNVLGQHSVSKASAWTQEQTQSFSGDEMAVTGGSPYSEVAVDTSWGEEHQYSGGTKTYTKTPQVGLFVSRGEGRYEKLIQCEECGKVCRTSNMARHKKRYCITSPSVGQTRKNYTQALKDMSYGSPKAEVYRDNPEKESHYPVSLTSSTGNFKSLLPNMDSFEMESSMHSEDFVNRTNDRGARLIANDSSFDDDKSITIKQEYPDTI